uniref:ATP synthase F0 subunit 8 n=1 Tax=Loxocera planivena TaxID=2963722 RepID=UPI002115A55F|nr:ATP synthase F0 subunit 8 [Loxocera planivena]UTM10353.1 ATP synthase F0 subunit 8 [Loxocera planivena]
MPQMAPIKWLSLFIIFSTTFIMFNIMNYYNIFPLAPKLTLMKTNKKFFMMWKW